MPDIINPTMRALFDSLQGEFSDAEARTEGGFGGWWPPAGTHECLVTGITVNDQAKFKCADGRSISAVRVEFHYKLTNDARTAISLDPEAAGEWRGSDFTLFDKSQLAFVDEWRVKALPRDLARLKGHLKNILRLPDEALKGSPAQLLTQAQAKIEQGVVVMVQVEINLQDPKKVAHGATPKEYRREYINSLVSG